MQNTDVNFEPRGTWKIIKFDSDTREVRVVETVAGFTELEAENARAAWQAVAWNKTTKYAKERIV